MVTQGNAAHAGADHQRPGNQQGATPEPLGGADPRLDVQPGDALGRHRQGEWLRDVVAGPHVGLVVGPGLGGQGERDGVGVVLLRSDRRIGTARLGSSRERAQPGEQLVEGRPVARLRVEGSGHHVAQVRRQPGEIELAAADPVHDRHRGPAAEGRMTEAGVGDRGRPGVHVGGGRGVLAVQDLGSEVAGRAEQPAGVGELGVVGDPGQAEVDEDRGPTLHQHVGGLHVAVQDADRVHRQDSLGEARGQPVEIGSGHRTLVDDLVVQRQPGHVAGGDVRDRRPRVGVDDLGHPATVHPAQRADLAGQSVPGLVVTDDVRTQHLERDPVAVLATGEVNDAHPALAQLAEERVAADRGSLGGLRCHAARLPARSRVPARDTLEWQDDLR